MITLTWKLQPRSRFFNRIEEVVVVLPAEAVDDTVTLTVYHQSTDDWLANVRLARRDGDFSYFRDDHKVFPTEDEAKAWAESQVPA